MIEYKKYSISDAISILSPKARYSIVNDDYDNIVWTNPDAHKPSLIQIQEKIKELELAEPMRLLRIERNRRLQETDWMANSDVSMTDAWKIYRQSLRDLPSTASPVLDEQGNLINVTWPTKPE